MIGPHGGHNQEDPGQDGDAKASHPDAGLPGFRSLQTLSGELLKRGRSVAGYAASSLSLKALSNPLLSLLSIEGSNLAISWPIAPEIDLASKPSINSISSLLDKANHSPTTFLWA